MLRKTLLAFSVTLASLAAGPASAQCATGVDTGGTGCVPPGALEIPGYQAPDAYAPRRAGPPRWTTSWGAIAIDPETGQAGTVQDKNTEAEAVSAALRDCGSKGAATCEVSLKYHDQCAAVAWGRGKYGVASAVNEERAQRLAMDSCGQQACTIVYTACSLPKEFVDQ